MKLFVLSLLLVSSVALAAPVTSTASSATGLTVTTGLVLVVLMAGSYFFRRLAPQSHWSHTAAGAIGLAIASAALSAAAQTWQEGASWRCAVTAALGAVVSLLATSNPTMNAPAPPFDNSNGADGVIQLRRPQ